MLWLLSARTTNEFAPGRTRWPLKSGSNRHKASTATPIALRAAASRRVDVLDAKGALLYSMPVKDTSEVRGEFPDAQGNLTGVRVKQAKAALTLRLPLLKEASIVRVMNVEAPNAETELGQVPYPQVEP